jgi:hypothetical protein
MLDLILSPGWVEVIGEFFLPAPLNASLIVLDTGVVVRALTCVKDKAVPVTADYLGRRDREAVLHSSKVRTANRPFALYKTWISSPQSSTSARRGR